MDTPASGFDTAVAVPAGLPPRPQHENSPVGEAALAVSGVRALRDSTNISPLPAGGTAAAEGAGATGTAATAAATTAPVAAATGESRPRRLQLPVTCWVDDSLSGKSDGGAAPKSKKRKQSPAVTESTNAVRLQPCVCCVQQYQVLQV